MVNASQRIVGRFGVKKDSVTPEVMKALVESKLTVKSLSLSDLRSLALCCQRWHSRLVRGLSARGPDFDSRISSPCFDFFHFSAA